MDIFVKNNRVTLASVFYTAWGILIELGEIGGEEAVVMVNEHNGDKLLCAYIVPIREFEIAELKEPLKLSGACQE